MADMQDFDVEVQNLFGSDPESFVVTVATAGITQTVTPSNTRPIACASIHVPDAGPNVGTNEVGDFILYSTDGGTVFHQLKVNEFVGLPGNFDSLIIDASKNGMVATVDVRS